MSDQVNPNPQPELSEQDAGLLSAYLDDMLSDNEQAQLEARLATDAFLRSELAAMRQTVAMIDALPLLKSPRNFTVTAADLADNDSGAQAFPANVTRLPSVNIWTLASVAAAIVVVIAGLLLIVPTQQPGGAAPAADQAESIAFGVTEVSLTDSTQPAPAELAMVATATSMPTQTIQTTDNEQNDSAARAGDTEADDFAMEAAEDAGDVAEAEDESAADAELETFAADETLEDDTLPDTSIDPSDTIFSTATVFTQAFSVTVTPDVIAGDADTVAENSVGAGNTSADNNFPPPVPSNTNAATTGANGGGQGGGIQVQAPQPTGRGLAPQAVAQATGTAFSVIFPSGDANNDAGTTGQQAIATSISDYLAAMRRVITEVQGQ